MLFLLFAPVFLFGFILLIVGMTGQTRWMMVVGGILMLPLIAGFISDARLPDVEWNPLITSDTEIVGTYAKGDDRVTLASDKTFTYHILSRNGNGTWTRSDWNLALDRGGGNIYENMRLIQADGAYYLMPHEPEDPDMWDGDLGLPKVE